MIAIQHFLDVDVLQYHDSSYDTSRTTLVEPHHDSTRSDWQRSHPLDPQLVERLLQNLVVYHALFICVTKEVDLQMLILGVRRASWDIPWPSTTAFMYTNTGCWVLKSAPSACVLHLRNVHPAVGPRQLR